MTIYTKVTNFTAKDSLLTGDPNKIVKGVEIDTEFVNIASAFGQVASSTDLSTGLAAQLRNKNRIINGNFDVWQRATSQTSSGYGSADRWNNIHLGSTKTISLQAFTLGQTDVPGEPIYYSRTVVTSVADAGNLVIKQQRMESVRTLAGQTCTVSFWAKADSSKNIAIEFAQNFGTGGSPSAQVTAIGVQLVALTNTWTRYTKTIAIPSISGKTLGTAGNDSLEFTFWFEAGSDWNARTASLGQQSGTFDIAQVQIEAGSVASDFEYRPIAEELALCQRYFYMDPLGTFAGEGFATNGTSISAYIGFPVSMRATPSVVFITTTYTNASGINVLTSSPLGLTAFATGTVASPGANAFFKTGLELSAEL